MSSRTSIQDSERICANLLDNFGGGKIFSGKRIFCLCKFFVTKHPLTRVFVFLGVSKCIGVKT